jgi:hypothetical protein
MALVIDAMELQYTQKLDAFCIVSSDADFTPLVMHLKSNGHDVYGFGQKKTPDPFVNACTAFLYVENLGNGAEGDSSQAEDAVVTKEKPQRIKTEPTGAKDGASPAPLACDTKLVNILRGAVSASVREDGWAAMSAAGAAAKRQAPIDPRNYGVKNFTALFEATGLFEVQKASGGRVYVADRRNSDRSATPTV